MQRALLLSILAAGVVSAQSPSTPASAGRLAFDVVSIKPVQPSTIGSDWRYAAGRMTGTFTAKVLISLAFGTPDRTSFPARQIVGGPDWLDTLRFAINAEVSLDGQTEKIDQGRFGRPVAPFVRSLLEDRFKLVTHMGTSDFPVYAVIVARSDGRLGPKLRRSTLTESDCDARRQHPTMEKPPCGTVRGRPGAFVAVRAPLSSVVGFLGPVDRIVLDRSGLDGLFDAEFQHTDDAVSIFTDVQEQLGLKLEPRREPLDTVVVDHIEQPTLD